jgi:hypothetical protein
MAPFDQPTLSPSPDLPAPAQAVVEPAGPERAPQAEPPDRPRPAGGDAPGWAEKILLFLVVALAFLLASSPARNSDLWMHLARGRLAARGELSSGPDLGPPPGAAVGTTWLYDLVCYGLYSAFGGTGLVLSKALLVALLALFLLRLSRTGASWWLAIFATALALLALSVRLPLQPATVSYLFLTLTLWFLRDRVEVPGGRPSGRPPWPLLLLFLAWVNMDSGFLVGLGTVALVWLGQALDEARGAAGRDPGWPASLLRRGLWLVLLAAVCLLNPIHVYAFTRPLESGPFGPVTSPFQGDSLAHLGRTAAGVAYSPLLVLSLLSFVLALPRWHWRRFLPWLGLVLLSAFQARAIPFFAVVAGPVLAWGFEEFVARGFAAGTRPDVWRRGVRAGHVLTAVLVVGLLVCAWPGWLQAPPFEPRRWTVEVPASLQTGVDRTGEWLRASGIGPQARGLHLCAETAYAFAWFCPDQVGVRDEGLAAAIRGDAGAPADWEERMRAAGITHVFLYDPDRGRLSTTLARLADDPRQWPLLHVEGYLAVFGWRDPARRADLFAGRQLDLEQLAFHPSADKKAPERGPNDEPQPRQWWDAFWQPIRPRPIDQDEATLHLFHAEALRQSAPRRHIAVWMNVQSAALVGAAAGWAGPGGLLDARLRLARLGPKIPEQLARFETLPVPDQLAHALMHQFELQRDDTPPALLYLAVRAARRAVAVNPNDAQAYLVLGESYLRLLHDTRERGWGERLPDLFQLRRVQASTALNRAVALKPDFAQAHLDLSRLYGEMGYLDLTLEHLRAYLRVVQEAGPPPGAGAGQARVAEDPYQEELNQLAKEVDKRKNLFEVATAGWKVVDRAFKAFEMGLAGKARDLLLESNIAYFGEKGMALELDLMLRTGRARDVWKWTGELTSEHQNKLGASYYRLRAQALAACGDYALAQEEYAQMSGSLALGPAGQGPVPYREVMAVLVGRRVLREQAGATNIPDLLVLNGERYLFRNRLAGLAQGLRQEADLSVLRGLLALEAGEVGEAEIAFREALALWKDEASASRGAGLDFGGRAVAGAALRWLE